MLGAAKKIKMYIPIDNKKLQTNTDEKSKLSDSFLCINPFPNPSLTKTFKITKNTLAKATTP